jgi:hypothetical protein
LPPYIQKEVDKGGGEISRVVEKLGQDTFITIKTAAGDTIRTLEKAGGDAINTVEKAGSDTVETTTKAAGDVTATYKKAWRDVDDQSKRSFKDAVDAGKAAANFVKNQAEAHQEAWKNAEKRLRDGKVVDSMWGLATDPAKSGEKNFAKATQESDLLNTAAATAASVYGGPAGAAAYAAWSTYRRTGDANLALRAGITAGVTSQVGGSVAKLPAGTAGEVVKKAALSGAAGGIAVAAAGGDEQAIKDGFLKSAGAVLVQGGTDRLKAYSPEAKDAYDTVQCLSARDVDCLSNTTWARNAKGKILYDDKGKPRIDTSKLDPNQYVGKWTGLDPKSIEAMKNAYVTQVSKLPDTEAIPLMKNQWVLTWNLGKEQNIPHNNPAVVLTYVGKDPPFNSTVEYGGAVKKSPKSGTGKKQTAAIDPSQVPGTGNRGAARKGMTSKGVQMFTVELREIPGAIRSYKKLPNGSWTRVASETGIVTQWRTVGRISLNGCNGTTLLLLPSEQYEVFVPDRGCQAMVAWSRIGGAWFVMGTIKSIR